MTITPKVGVMAQYAFYKAKNPNRDDLIGSNHDFTLTGYAGVDAKVGAHTVGVGARTDFTPYTEARGGEGDSPPGVTRPVMSFHYNVKFNITRNTKGELNVTGSVVSLSNGLHPNARVSLSAERGRTIGRVAACSSLRRDTPLFIPGAGRCAEASLAYKIFKGVLLTASAGVEECGGGVCVVGTGGLMLRR